MTNSDTETPPDPLRPDVSLLIKLGSMIVHYQEMLSEKCHEFDIAAVQTLEQDSEVKQWLSEMTTMAFLPVKR